MGKIVDVLGRNIAITGLAEDADIVHCHTWYSYLAGCLIKQFLEIPMVITVHSLEPKRPWKREQAGTDTPAGVRHDDKLDQFFRVEEGTGEAVLDGVRTVIRAGFAVVVPAGTNHNIINIGSVPLKIYTLYALPNHRDGVVHHTRAEAEADNEHFDGKMTE